MDRPALAPLSSPSIAWARSACRRGDDLQAEDAAVKQAAVQLVFQPSAPGEAPVEVRSALLHLVGLQTFCLELQQ